MSTYTYLDLSTAHITEHDNSILTDGTRAVVYTPSEYGYYISVPVAKNIMWTRYCSAGLSRAFYNLMKYASDHGHRLIVLDSYGEIDESLPHFDW